MLRDLVYSLGEGLSVPKTHGKESKIERKNAMKQFFCLLLAIVTAVSMASCATAPSEPVTETTTAPAATEPAPTEPVFVPVGPEEEIPDGMISDAEGALAQNATTVTFDTLEEYENFLRELGFIEVSLDTYRVNVDLTDMSDHGEPACIPLRLTYKEDVFCLEFNYINEDYTLGVTTLDEGWKLYGTKNATAPFNISPMTGQGFEYLEYSDSANDTFQFSPNKNYVRLGNYLFMNFEDPGTIPEGVSVEVMPTASQAVWACYYPKTNNLYNAARDFGAGVSSFYSARILFETFFDEKADLLGGYEWCDVVENVIFSLNDVEETATFQTHMTLVDWCFSEHNQTGWTYVDDTTICSPDGILVGNANQKIVNLGKKNADGQYVITVSE